MNQENNYRDILQVEFQSRKARNQYYSLRAFAQSIGIGSGALSEILNGKRNLGLNKAHAIVEKLNFDEFEKSAFLASVQSNSSGVVNTPRRKNRELSLEAFEIVSSTDCMSILALADLDDFRLDVEWIAYKLGIKIKDVEKVIPTYRHIEM